MQRSRSNYRLSSDVPDQWIPLLPVQLPSAGGVTISRLKRGAVLAPDGSQQVRQVLGDVLKTNGPLLVHDEAVPREGVSATRHRAGLMARRLLGSLVASGSDAVKAPVGCASTASRQWTAPIADCPFPPIALLHFCLLRSVTVHYVTGSICVLPGRNWASSNVPS